MRNVQKKGRVKKKSLSSLKKRLEEIQKEETIAKYGNDCFTCPQKNLHGMNCQLGHVPWPRSILAVQLIFNLRYTRIQCFQCNINHGGMGAKALERMIREGIDTNAMWEENLRLKGKTVPRKWYEEEIARRTRQLPHTPPGVQSPKGP